MAENDTTLLVPSEELQPDDLHIPIGGVSEAGVPRRAAMEHFRSPSMDSLHEAVTLSWKNVNVEAVLGRRTCRKDTRVTKTILTDVSGIVTPGNLFAIMGASGAGKSTLMNVLTQRNLGSLQVEGEVLVNGEQLGRGIQRVSAYVQQDDLFMGCVTVKEQLWFTAMLRMDSHLKDAERIQRAERVTQELGLTKCANTMIGIHGTKKGISGGERKRLAFACEVMTNPALLFCDEPTSGLDSYMAASVVQTLKKMAEQGKTVLCTIHQPSSEVFAQFDNLLLLAEGKVAYMGKTAGALDLFSSLGYPCPMNYNPADHFIATLAITPDDEEKSRVRVAAIVDANATSQGFRELMHQVDSCSRPRTTETPQGLQGIESLLESSLTKMANISRQEAQHRGERDSSRSRSTASNYNPDDPGNPLLQRRFLDDEVKVRGQVATVTNGSRYKASGWTQFRVVTWRSWASHVRDPIVFRARIAQSIIMATLFGLIYLRQTYDQKGVTNINGALFLLQIGGSLAYVFGVINTFPKEYPVVLREYQNGMYNILSFFLSKVLAELPTFIITPVIMASIAYWMIGLYPAAAQFGIFVGVLVLIANVAVSFGYMTSCLSDNVTVVLTIAPLIQTPLMIFGGFFVNSGSIPVWLIWLKYISWFSYANEILVINQWKDVTNITCDLPSLPTRPSLSAQISMGIGQEGGPAILPCFTDGQMVIQSMSFDENNVPFDFIMLGVLLVGFKVLAFIALALRTWLKR